MRFLRGFGPAISTEEVANVRAARGDSNSERVTPGSGCGGNYVNVADAPAMRPAETVEVPVQAGSADTPTSENPEALYKYHY